MAASKVGVSKWAFFSVCVVAGLLVALIAAWSLSLASAATIWTAAGAVGSVGAAVAAVYAARAALAAAQVPIESAQQANLLHCRSIAPALGYEFRRASEDIALLIHQLNGAAVDGLAKYVTEFLSGGFLSRTTTLDRYIDKFQMFGEDGAAMALAASSISNLRAQVLSWRDRALLNLLSVRLIDDEVRKVRLLEAEARHAKSRIDELADALVRYGGGKSQWEV